jgi:hypothetical protein
VELKLSDAKASHSVGLYLAPERGIFLKIPALSAAKDLNAFGKSDIDILKLLAKVKSGKIARGN